MLNIIQPITAFFVALSTKKPNSVLIFYMFIHPKPTDLLLSLFTLITTFITFKH